MARHYALILGNSLYDHIEPSLTAPALDAAEVRRVLTDPLIGDYICQLELNQDSQRLRWIIEDLFIHRVQPSDTALLYFSGHGLISDTGELHLATRDTDKRYLGATSISAEFIRRIMAESTAKRKIVILDCCHSGAFTNGIKGELDTVKRLRLEGGGVAVLAASREWQSARETERLSVFTSCLVEGLEGAAVTENEEVIRVGALHSFIDLKMRTLNIGQKPVLSLLKQEGEIVIAYNPRLPKFILPENVTHLLNSPRLAEVQQGIELLKQHAKSGDEFQARVAVSMLLKLGQSDQSRTIQQWIATALKEANKDLHQPRVHFSSGEEVTSIADWVNLVEQSKQYWPEAAELLYSGVLEEWLKYVKRPDLADTAAKIFRKTRHRLIGLEQFQRQAGPFPPQRKVDTSTNINELLGELIWLRVWQRRPREVRFKISHQGRGYLHGQVISRVGWLSLDQPEFGCLPGDTAEVRIKVDPDKYKWYGFYGFPLDFRLY